ncbi:MAG: hypothetical protein OEM03_12165 [Chromatiales bacterium]|nr:hypothetical protein [Chromatiales bacterium]
MNATRLFRTLVTAMAAVVIGSFALVGTAIAQGKGPGGPGGGGGGGGGDDVGTPPDYGDLVILYRDESGVPLLTTDRCQQPIAFESDTCTNYGTFECVVMDPDNVDNCLTRVVPVDPATCAILPAGVGCTHEIEFGRSNSARSPASVFESQLEDVVVKLATADRIGLDAAGRLVACVDGGVDDSGADLPDASSAVDSPLQNLAIYKQLMTYGYLGDEGQITLPASVMDTAARGIGVAVDKGGKVSVDMVVYLNQIMGLSDLPTTILGEPICIDPKEEVMGNIEYVHKCFLNYGNIPGGGVFGYGRGGNFGSLPFPAYIDDGLGNKDGVFEVLKWTEVDPDSPTFDIYRGPIFDRVFGGQEGKGTANIAGFVQAADDTREVINYMHSWPLPIEFVAGDGTVTAFQTPVTCEDSGGTGYDLSISADSGLQVPVQMAPNDEGREFIVTIANAGPDAASGSVWVTAESVDTVIKIATFATDEDGNPILDAEGNPVVESWDAGPFEYEFTDLAKGASASWTSTFIVDPAKKTTINWTATIVAEHDVNSTNNTVYETTNVIQTGKGGGRGGGE